MLWGNQPDERQPLPVGRRYFRPVLRWLSAFLLVHFIAVLTVPAWITVDFMLERDRIARDLCVQRMVTEGLPTCHGE